MYGQGVFECVCSRGNVITGYVSLNWVLWFNLLPPYCTAQHSRVSSGTAFKNKASFSVFATELHSRITGTVMAATHFVTELWGQWSREVGS